MSAAVVEDARPAGPAHAPGAEVAPLDDLRQESSRLREQIEAMHQLLRKGEERRRAMLHIMVDMNDANRAFTAKFAPQDKGIHPTMIHAGVYSAVTHYLKTLEQMKSDSDGKAVVAKMKSIPTEDKLFGKGTIRADGRKIHDMYLFEVKKPAESKGPWDYYKVRATIPAAEAFRPLEEGECSLAKKSRAAMTSCRSSRSPRYGSCLSGGQLTEAQLIAKWMRGSS